MKLSTDDRFKILGTSFLVWFMLMFNIIFPSDGFFQIMVQRSVLIAEAVIMLVLGLILAVTSMIYSIKEIRTHIQLKQTIASD